METDKKNEGDKIFPRGEKGAQQSFKLWVMVRFHSGEHKYRYICIA